MRKNSRRYRMKFGWLGCCMQELECRQCPDHGPVKKDCNNHCWTRRPAYKKCGVCIGGNTGFDEKHGMVLDFYLYLFILV